MSITYQDAVDELFSTFLTYWNANVSSVLDYSPEIRWRNKEVKTSPDPAKHYLRISQQTVIERQASLKNINKLHESRGFITVQLYFSKSSLVDGDDRALSAIAKEGFRSAAGSDVWYRNPRIKELPPEEDYFRADVISDYVYYEVT